MSKPSAKRTAKQKRKKNEQRKKELNFQEKQRYKFQIAISGKSPKEFISFVKNKVDELLSNTSKARELKNNLDTDPYSKQNPIIRLNMDVFISVPDTLRKKYIDSFRCSYRILIDGKNLLIKFRQLRQMNCDGSYCYFSPRLPKVDIDGVNYVVAYSKHALHSIAERAVFSLKNYLSYEKIFEWVYSYRYFETYKKGILLWGPCQKGFFSEVIGSSILGKDIKTTSYYKLGYCPIVKCGNLAVVKTFLPPGFRTTPEGIWYRKKYPKDTTIDERVKKLSHRSLMENQDFSLLRQFHHEAGMEQVKDIYVKVLHNGF
jgi:hypothetical protein